uniref:Extensin-like n=1 Tax=Drosophila rhopaloa TaxID=1041015 RepID=A0A6P4E4R6_DRORH
MTASHPGRQSLGAKTRSPETRTEAWSSRMATSRLSAGPWRSARREPGSVTPGPQAAPQPRGGGSPLARPVTGGGGEGAAAMGGPGGRGEGGPVAETWEGPPTPRYTAEEPSPDGKDEEEVWAPSPPRWLPEVPPTPRYEPEWHYGEDPTSEGGAPMATPPWRPARPPTSRYHQPEPRLKSPETPPPATEETTTVRTDVPAAHVSHSTRAFVAEGVRWRQQSVVWTWPERPATEAGGAPKVSPRDPRRRCRPDTWAPPTPSTIHPEGGNTPGGAGGERTVGVARARGQPSTPSAAATICATSVSSGSRRLARDCPRRLA